jgi:hypothetical protein
VSLHHPIFPVGIDKCSRSSEPFCTVRFSVYASFELGSMLGRGDLLRTFETCVAELLDRSENSRCQLLSF